MSLGHAPAGFGGQIYGIHRPLQPCQSCSLVGEKNEARSDMGNQVFSRFPSPLPPRSPSRDPTTLPEPEVFDGPNAFSDAVNGYGRVVVVIINHACPYILSWLKFSSSIVVRSVLIDACLL